jgi:UDP-glucoronosyl and UDP-glucosyl transferase.
MGSNLKSADMPEGTVKALTVAFSKLKQKVLWKWEADSLPGQPANLKLAKWLPQSDILGNNHITFSLL